MMSASTNKKSTKVAEKEAFLGEVKATIAQAHEAAEAAYAAYAKTAERSKDGHIADSCGGASVVVYKPSYRLRTALAELGEIKPGYRGGWHVSQFTRCVASQSITANEVACRAALDVLIKKYGDEGQFFNKSFID